MILTKLDQHVNEMMTTAEKKFRNFLWSRFLIIVHNVNMVGNGKRNRRLNPDTLLCELCSRLILNVVHGAKAHLQIEHTD